MTITKKTLAIDRVAIRPELLRPTAASPAEAYMSTMLEGASRDTIGQALRKIVSIVSQVHDVGSADIFSFPWAQMDYATVAGLRSHLQAHCAPSSANLYLAALRGVLRACAAQKLMTYEAMYAALAGASKVKGTREPSGRALDRSEIAELFKQCDASTAIGARDAALLTLLYGCGLRRAEAVSLDLTSVKVTGAGNERRAAILVRGKGNRERTMYLTSRALGFIDAWLKHRGRAVGPLICPCDERGVRVRRLTHTGVYSRLNVLAKRAGIDRISPHDLRRSFVSDLLDEGEDALTVSKLAGHVQVQTTMLYDRRGEGQRQGVLERFHGDKFAMDAPGGSTDRAPRAEQKMTSSMVEKRRADRERHARRRKP